jgi:hypothetical protein
VQKIFTIKIKIRNPIDLFISKPEARCPGNSWLYGKIFPQWAVHLEELRSFLLIISLNINWHQVGR